jgi:hypothetical protein
MLEQFFRPARMRKAPIENLDNENQMYGLALGLCRKLANQVGINPELQTGLSRSGATAGPRFGRSCQATARPRNAVRVSDSEEITVPNFVPTMRKIVPFPHTAADHLVTLGRIF